MYFPVYFLYYSWKYLEYIRKYLVYTHTIPGVGTFFFVRQNIFVSDNFMIFWLFLIISEIIWLDWVNIARQFVLVVWGRMVRFQGPRHVAIQTISENLHTTGQSLHLKWLHRPKLINKTTLNRKQWLKKPCNFNKKDWPKDGKLFLQKWASEQSSEPENECILLQIMLRIFL